MSYKEILSKVRESKDILSKKRAQYNNYKEKTDYLESLKLSFKSNGIRYENENENLAQESFIVGNYSSAMDYIETAVNETEEDYTDSEKIRNLISNLSISFDDLEEESKEEFIESLNSISEKLSDGNISSARFDIDLLSKSFEEHVNIVDTSKLVLDQMVDLLDSSKDFILIDEFMDDSYKCQKLFESKEYFDCKEKSQNLLSSINEALEG